MLVWIKDAPSISKHTVDKVTDFVNLYVTCKKNDEMAELVNYQTHRHAHTCKKKIKQFVDLGFHCHHWTKP